MPQAVQSLLNKLAMAVADKTTPKSGGAGRKDDSGLSKPFHQLLNHALNPNTPAKAGKAQKPNPASKNDSDTQDNTLDPQTDPALSDNDTQPVSQSTDTMESSNRSTDNDDNTDTDKDTLNPDARQTAMASLLLATTPIPVAEPTGTTPLQALANVDISTTTPSDTPALPESDTTPPTNPVTDTSFATSPQGIALQAALQQATTQIQNADGSHSNTPTNNATSTTTIGASALPQSNSNKNITEKNGIGKPEKRHSKKENPETSDTTLPDPTLLSDASLSVMASTPTPTGEGMALPVASKGPSTVSQTPSDALPKQHKNHEPIAIGGAGLTVQNPPMPTAMKLAHSIPVTPENVQTPIMTDGNAPAQNSILSTNTNRIEPAMANTPEAAANAIAAGLTTDATSGMGDGSSPSNAADSPSNFSAQLESAMQTQTPSADGVAIPKKGMMNGIASGKNSDKSAPLTGDKGSTKATDVHSSFNKLAEQLNHRLGQTSDETADLMEGVQIEAVNASASDTTPSATMDLSLSGAASAPSTPNTQATGNSGGNATSLPTFMSNAQNPMEQVMDGAVYSVKNGHKELIIRLNPDNLGEVRINLISKGANEVTARLIASTPETQNLLQNQMHSLKSSLEAQGIQVDHLSVVLAGRPDTKQDFHSSSQEQTFQQSSQQQSTSQHQHHPQHGNENNLFAQMGGQGFQHQSRTGYGQPASQPDSGLGQSGDDVGGISGSVAHEASSPMSTTHDNGQVSILA
jgi:hypothetical protein